jgi:hypothetical protein
MSEDINLVRFDQVVLGCGRLARLSPSKVSFVCFFNGDYFRAQPGNTKWGTIAVLLTSCLTGLELAV